MSSNQDKLIANEDSVNTNHASNSITSSPSLKTAYGNEPHSDFADSFISIYFINHLDITLGDSVKPAFIRFDSSEFKGKIYTHFQLGYNLHGFRFQTVENIWIDETARTVYKYSPMADSLMLLTDSEHDK